MNTVILLFFTLLGALTSSVDIKYEYSVKFDSNVDTYELPCSPHIWQTGDTFYYYKQTEGTHNPEILYSVRADSSSNIDLPKLINLTLEPNERIIYCDVRRIVEGIENVMYKTKFIFTNSSSQVTFVYDPEDVTYVYTKLNETVELVCPIVSATAPRIDWYRGPNFIIAGQNERELVIQSVASVDVGVYYCAIHRSGGVGNAIVAKLVYLLTTSYNPVIRKAEPVGSDNHGTTQYDCPLLDGSRHSYITWEQPLGTIHLGKHQETWKSESTVTQRNLYCRYVHNFASIPTTFVKSSKRARRNSILEPQINLRLEKSENMSLVFLTCHWMSSFEEPQSVIYRWSNNFNDQQITSQEIQVTPLDPYALSGGSMGVDEWTCHVEQTDSGTELGRSTTSLIPKTAQSIGVLSMNDRDKLYTFRSGDVINIMCNADSAYSESAKDIEWQLNGEKLPPTIHRYDHILTSSLILRNITNEIGIYSCVQKTKVEQIYLYEWSPKLALSIEPKSDSRVANADEMTEFHCRFSGRENGNQFIEWFFIPKGGEEEMYIHSLSDIERPADTPLSSFLTINDVQKYHEGEYICRALGLEERATLVVATRELTISPSSVDARHGTTVRFLCEVSPVKGVTQYTQKLYWMRTDRRDLRPDKEEVIGSSGGKTLLLVKSLDESDHNTTYKCTDGVSEALATLYIRDICEHGQRPCDSRECVDSSKFCDGVQDCADGSDELPNKCDECAPNEYRCLPWKERDPLRKCYSQYWHCDGEDDCGNTFDESDCSAGTGECDGTHFICPTSQIPIPRAYLCDNMVDCEGGGEDERECSNPIVIEPAGTSQVFGLQSGNLTLKCVVYGRPPPAVSWRFNWGRLRDDVQYVVENKMLDCNKVISHLTLINLEPRASGLYTCEAVSRTRILAPDIAVNVAKGGFCNPPLFNDAAWFEDMCLECYCSGLTDQCQSAKGYEKSPLDKLWNIPNEPWRVVSNTSGKFEEIENGVVSTYESIRIVVDPADVAYIEGSFGLSGSWVTSYGFDFKYIIQQFGENVGHISGALFFIKGESGTLYWCPSKDRAILYTRPDGHQNEVTVRLNERDRWYTDAECLDRLNQSEGRHQFMRVLSNVEQIGIRVKNFKSQKEVELLRVQLEYATMTDRVGAWVDEVEQCVCPQGYKGLSCETCASGYQRDPSDSSKCRKKCNCDTCDKDGTCLECPGSRAGPYCQNCKRGYYRPEISVISEDCRPCDSCNQSLDYVTNECMDALSTKDDKHICKCEPVPNGGIVSPNCDLCKLYKTSELPIPPNITCDEEVVPNKTACNPEGTDRVNDLGDCECKTGYSGPTCQTCADDHFPFGERCLKCYCAGQTTSCKLADDHYFWNVTANNPDGYEFDVWLARRSIMGGLERLDYTANSEPRVETSWTGFTVINPLLQHGLIHLGMQIKSPGPEYPMQSDLPIYRNLYGGQMSFRLNTSQFDAHLVTQGDARVIVELETVRFGRVWAQAVFNLLTQRYEVRFTEDWWPTGWTLGTVEKMDYHKSIKGLNRAELLRALSTTRAIAIVTSSGESGGIHGLQLNGLHIQIARRIRDPSLKTDSISLPSAPVEQCSCPQTLQDGERELSLSCEGCRDPKRNSVISSSLSGDDIVCGGCNGPECNTCPEGQFKYDIFSGQVYETCRPRIVFDTQPQVIVVKVGDPVTFNCRVTVHRGGIVSHNWSTPDLLESRNKLDTQKRSLRVLPTKNQLSIKVNDHKLPYQSAVVLRIESVGKQHAGTYTCHVTGVGSNLEQSSYLIVQDEDGIHGLVPPVEEDVLNQKYPINIPSFTNAPGVKSYTIQPDLTDPNATIVKISLERPVHLDTHQLVWFSPDHTRLPSDIINIDKQNGRVEIRLPVPYEEFASDVSNYDGYLIGGDPVFNPYWNRLSEPKMEDEEAIPVTVMDIIKPPGEIIIPFMQPHTVRVSTKPGTSMIKVDWKRIASLPEDVATNESVPWEFPEGMSQVRNDLQIWAAAEQHEGVYEAVVYRDSDREELDRFNVTIRVAPMRPGESTHLKPGEAVDLPEVDGQDDVNATVTEAPVWDFVVQGFTPEAEDCEDPTWLLVDYQRNTQIDVTDRVHRLSASSFRVDYPLSSGIYLRFQCKPVPRSQLTGEIRFNITSDDPRIILQTYYEDPNSTFPTRLICLDLNPSHMSSLNISSDVMDRLRIEDALTTVTIGNETFIYGFKPRQLELDWYRIGGFDPHSDAGHFTCFVNNSITDGTRVIDLPDMKVPENVSEDPFSRVYIYSPDVYIGAEVDGKSTVEVEEGSRLRLYCKFDARPASMFTGWSTESVKVDYPIDIVHKKYSSLIQTLSIPLIMDDQQVDCKFGEQMKSVVIKVIPKGTVTIHANVTSDSRIGDRIIGLSGDNLILKCEVKQTHGQPVSIDRIDWIAQYSNGVRRSLTKSKIAESVTLSDDGREVLLSDLTRKTVGLKVFCVVRPENAATAVQAYYPSEMVELWIRTPKLTAFIRPVDEHGIIVGTEAETLRLKCLVIENRLNKTRKDVIITWETRVLPRIQEPTKLGVKRIAGKNDMPWLVTSQTEQVLFVGKLKQQDDWVGEIRCHATDVKNNSTATSDWVPLEVKPGDAATQMPQLRLVVEASAEFPFYPSRVECVDDNKEHESEVTWIRSGDAEIDGIIENKPNSAILVWKVGDREEFNPISHAGVYICRATNPYASISKPYYFPKELMGKDSIPYNQHVLRITSSVNQIMDSDGTQPFVRVNANKPFELLCTYFGHPPPADGISWSVIPDSDDQPRDTVWLAKRGLRVMSGRYYWSHVSTNRFDSTGRQTGIFKCSASKPDGSELVEQTIKIELYKVIVKVEGLAEPDLLFGHENSNGSFSCRALDGYSNEPLPDPTYSWYFVTPNGQRVHPAILARDVSVEKSEIKYSGLHPMAEGVQIRCLVSNDSTTYFSPYFAVRVRRISPPTWPPNQEPSIPIWKKGDGSEGVLLIINGTTENTGHVSLLEGNDAKLTCVAVDPLTKTPFARGEFYYGWRLTTRAGEPISTLQLATEPIQMGTTSSDADSVGIFAVTNARASPNPPQPTARIQCLATRRRAAVTYYSKPIDYVVYPQDTEPNYPEEVNERNEYKRINVTIEGLDEHGMLKATEGDVKLLRCVVTYSGKEPLDSGRILYTWEISTLDNIPLDSTNLVRLNEGNISFIGSEMTINGLRKTSSARGRCRISIEDQIAGQRYPIGDFYSPYFRFDVTDKHGQRDFIPKRVHPNDDKNIVVEIDGLDKSGYLTNAPGEDSTLFCKARNISTNEEISTDAFGIEYGWEFRKFNGLPTGSTDIAGSTIIDPQSGRLWLVEMKPQPTDRPTRLRCFVRLVSKPDRGYDKQFTSPYVFVNVPPKDDVLPEFVDISQTNYELNIAETREDDKTIFECIVRDKETDTLIDLTLAPTQTMGWQFPLYPSGSSGNPGDVAKVVLYEENKLILNQIRTNLLPGTKGRCWFFDGQTYYYSPYFIIIGPQSSSDGRVRVQVDAVGPEDDRQYICTAYDTTTGVQIQNVSYHWTFKTKTGSPVPSSYFFHSTHTKHNVLIFEPRMISQPLPEHLRNASPVKGRCVILYQPDPSNLTNSDELKTYSSPPFIIIRPGGDEMITDPGLFIRGPRIIAMVEGVKQGLVFGPEGGTTTLTCQAINVETSQSVGNLTYQWLVQQPDGSPVSTGSLAGKGLLIEGSAGNRLTLVGLRPQAHGLKGQCLITNTTSVDKEGREGESLLEPGMQIGSPFFMFWVNRSTSSKDKEDDRRLIEDYAINGDPGMYQVIISGLNEDGRLQAARASDAKLIVSVKDLTTGDILIPSADPDTTHIGLETRYLNRHPAPISALADSVLVHSDDGVIELKGMKSKSRPPVQFRVVVERNEEVYVPEGSGGLTKITKPMRYASDFVDVVILEDGDIIPSEPENITEIIYPVVDGLDRCGTLPVVVGSDAIVLCRPNDTRIPLSGLLFDWEIRHESGHLLPAVNLLSREIRKNSNRLSLYDLMETSVPLIGRCIISQPEEKGTKFTSKYFKIGKSTYGCGQNDSIVIPTEPGLKPGIPQEKYRVRIRIEGLDGEGGVHTEPGNQIILKCTALNASTDEPIPNSAIGWDFISDTGDVLYAGLLASVYEQTEDNQLRLTNLHANPNARGRCVVTLDQRVSLSSPYFPFDIREEGTTVPDPINPSYSDTRVRVEVAGLNQYRQISVTRVGDDSSLRCQAIVKKTGEPLLVAGAVLYGWEWRYMDEDPVSTTDVALNIEPDGEHLTLKGIRAQPGHRGRNVKGRCVVHVPANSIDENYPANKLLVYGSEYFTIDVVKQPAIFDPEEIPVPGKDDIMVTVNGLAEDGNLIAQEKESVAVQCEVRNSTTKVRLSTDGSRADYTVLYGWEFTDVTGRSIDSSLFANAISSDASGTLRLRGLAAPNRGNLPFKIRCAAVVSRRPQAPNQPHGPAKSYTSNYFALNIKRADGTSTFPDGSQTDISGKSIVVSVAGLKPDGALRALPGDDVQLTCHARDSETGDLVRDLAYGWDFRQEAGGLLSLGSLAHYHNQSENRLDLFKLKQVNLADFNARGRCVVHRENQVYRSSYFPIDVSVPDIDQKVEGDGRIDVTIQGIKTTPERSFQLKPNESYTLKCIAKDAESSNIVSTVQYGWDLRFKNVTADFEMQGILGPFVRSVHQEPSGILNIQTSEQAPGNNYMKLRCRVWNESMIYTSPFYSLLPDITDREPLEPQRPLYPKYRVQVIGLNADGEASAKPGENVELACVAFDGQSGVRVDGLRYLWDIRRSDDEPVDYNELVTLGVGSTGSVLKLEGVKHTTKTVKGRCLVVDGSKKRLGASDYFYFSIVGDESEPDSTITETKYANVTDERVVVTVNGLDDSGHFIGKYGDNGTLTCNVNYKEGVSGTTVRRTWQFEDNLGRPIALEQLSSSWNIAPNEGMLQLSDLQIVNGNFIKGRCLAEIHLDIQTPETTDDQSSNVENKTFYSSYFGVSITDDGTPIDIPAGNDVQLKLVVVTIDGLDEKGMLSAQTGDRRNLRCIAKYAASGDVLSNVQYVWDLRTAHGHPIALEQVAERVAYRADELDFIHLHPTTAGLEPVGRCVVFVATDSPLKYKSDQFLFNVSVPNYDGPTGSDDEITVRVSGISDDNLLNANQGDDVTLECHASEKINSRKLTTLEAVYEFQFTGSRSVEDDVYGGHVAKSMKQESLTDGGIRLVLGDIQSGSWYRGRCVVRLLSTRDKVYMSAYFQSNVKTQPTDPDMKATDQITINGITYDPSVLVKLYGVNENGTIMVTPGQTMTIRGLAIDVPSGKPIQSVDYAWVFESSDGSSINFDQLGDFINTTSTKDVSPEGHALTVGNYNSDGEGIRIRLLARVQDDVDVPDHLRGKTFSSTTYTFQTLGSETRQPEPTGGKYDPNNLTIRISGLSSDGTLTKNEGDSVSLVAEVIDKATGSPIDDQFEFGWIIGTGPDNRPVPLNDLAESVHIHEANVTMDHLKPTTRGSGGFRGQFILKLSPEQLRQPGMYDNESVTIYSDSFVIHVEPTDSETLPKEEENPFINWIPGSDTKDAVLVKVSPLESDGSVRIRPGGSLSLECVALNAVNLQRITTTDKVTPIYNWEIRRQSDGRLLNYNYISNGEMTVTQPSSEQDASRLEMTKVRFIPNVGDVRGRCVVRIRSQIFHSDYVPIRPISGSPIEVYEPSPKGQWSQDGNVKVIVSGLGAQGDLAVEEGSDVILKCEARDNNTNQLISSERVKYGWQTLDPHTSLIILPFTGSAIMVGSEMRLKQIALPEGRDEDYRFLGWCFVDVLDNLEPESQFKKYKSEVFEITVTSKQVLEPEKQDTSEIPEELYINVLGLNDDLEIHLKQGDELKLQCRAINTTTGLEAESDRLTYGWDWRALDGSQLNVGMIGNRIESHDNSFIATTLKPITAVKGRCIVMLATGNERPKQYNSDFFFLIVKSTGDGAKTTKQIGDDDAFVIELVPNMDGRIQFDVNSDAELQIVVKNNASEIVSPLETGFEIVYSTGEDAHMGEIASGFNFSSTEGKLELNGIKYPQKPIRLRAYAQVPPEGDTSADEEGSPLYRSAYYQIEIRNPDGQLQTHWNNTNLPEYDLAGEKYKVNVSGLDTDGRAAAKVDGQLKLTCKVWDSSDLHVKLEPNSYTWQFVDGQGYPANPANIGQQVHISQGNELDITGYHELAANSGICGRCLVYLPVPTMSDTVISKDHPMSQRYNSPYFCFTESKIVEPETTEQTPTPTEEPADVVTPEPVTGKPSPGWFMLKIDSPINQIETVNDNNKTIFARVQRPFELNCGVIFPADIAIPKSSTGEPLPRLVWYYRRPEIAGDVPIQAQIFPIEPPRMETLTITPQIEYRISIRSDAYSFRDEAAEFYCRAFLESEEYVAQQTVFIQKIPERYNVRIFDEELRNRVFAFVGTTKTLTCFVHDIATGAPIELDSYQWELSTNRLDVREWSQQSTADQPADKISGWRTNQLTLDSLKLPSHIDSLEADFEARCIARSNPDFDTQSQPFVLKVRIKPTIEKIRVFREQPEESEIDLLTQPEVSYDARYDYQLMCKPEIGGGGNEQVDTQWQKCTNDICEDLPTGKKLIFFANSTRYTDNGQFRCKVTVELKEYNFKMTKSIVVNIKRMAAPAIYSSDAMSYTTEDELSLRCTDESASPEANVTWSFEPHGEAPPTGKEPTKLAKLYVFERIYIFIIDRGQLMKEHSGRYTCSATNPYGSSNSTVEVNVSEEVRQGQLKRFRMRVR